VVNNPAYAYGTIIGVGAVLALAAGAALANLVPGLGPVVDPLVVGLMAL